MINETSGFCQPTLSLFKNCAEDFRIMIERDGGRQESSETICVGAITGAFICVPEREVVYAGTESRTGN